MPAPLPCGCRGTCWGLSWTHFEPQPGAYQTQAGQGKEMSALMVHQNHNFLVRHFLYLPKALHVPVAGVQRPPCQSHTPKNDQFLHGKRFGPNFSMMVPVEAPKLPGTGKQRQSGHFSLHLMVLTPNISIHLWDFMDVVMGRRACAVLGGQGRFMLGCSPSANTGQGKCSKAVFWQGTSQLTGFQLGWHCCWHMGNHRSQNHRNP